MEIAFLILQSFLRVHLERDTEIPAFSGSRWVSTLISYLAHFGPHACFSFPGIACFNEDDQLSNFLQALGPYEDHE